MDIQSLGFESGAIVAQVGMLVYMYKALSARVDKVEAHVDKRLNNGIQTKLHSIELRVSALAVEVAKIEGRCERCPSNIKGQNYNGGGGCNE